MLKTVWNVRFEGFDPYQVMEQTVENEVYKNVIGKNLHMKYGGTVELFSKIYVANVMATVKWWIYNYEDHDIELIRKMINGVCNDGLIKLLESKD